MKKLLAGTFLRITGWKSEGEAPTARNFVLVAAPHTSNWDLAYWLALSVVLEVEVSWVGKHSLFRWPFGAVMRRLGGIPVRRHVRQNTVQQIAKLFSDADDLALAVAAEGTRARGDYWKSGFYHVAKTAKVPIALAFLDYRRKVGGFRKELVIPSDDIRRDMDVVRAFYADKVGRYPEKFGEVRLRQETE